MRSDPAEPIAIVGMGLRLPGGSQTPDQFDEFLREGRSGIREIPRDRWDVDALRAQGPDDKGKIATDGGGFLDRLDLFDAAFFNISHREARYIDPQQRMVLETAWHALEDAGIDPAPLRRGNGGVYMGVSSFDYALRMGGLDPVELDGHLAAGCTIFSMSGRLSYFLGWRGPSVCVDTACSSSLSALHLAVQGLREGECDIALSGGVNAVHHPSFMVMFSHGQMLAADGQCKTFDESADGYSRAEGCVVLVLKRLADAQRAGDRIWALIRGTAIGQDGDSAGLTVPHGPSQEQVIRTALAAGGLAPDDVQYVEAHGTGTPLGDPIELGAIANVFSRSHSKERPLIVGSVKTNIGHAEPASGIVGVAKTVLQLRSGTVYPHLNLTEPSHRIPWDNYPVEIPTACRPWPGEIRRAVVNSFGFAGTIAAAVLEQAPETQAVGGVDAAVGTVSGTANGEPLEAPGSVFTLSAKTATGLVRQAERMRAFLDEHPEADPAELCYAANLGRTHLPHRAAGPVRSRADLEKLLAAAAAGGRPTGAAVRKVAFLFSGQGSQYPGMGAALYRHYPVFRERVDECDRMFAPHLEESVRDLIIGESARPELIDQTGYTQPALFTFEYALAGLWMSWGVQPSILIGHSIGEVVAAAVAGLFSLPDAVTLVAARARLMQSVRRAGGMAAVALPRESLEPRLAEYPDLALAAVNAPNQCSISGASEQLLKVTDALRAEGVQVTDLKVSAAFHSPLMTEVFDEFRAAIADVRFTRPELPLISNVTGAVARFDEIATPEYWVRHIGEPVLFLDGARAVERRGRHVFVEIGPSGALTALAMQCVDAAEQRWATSAHRKDPSDTTILRGLAELYTAGAAVSWRAVHRGRVATKARLPLYEFERKSYWLPTESAAGVTGAGGPGSDRHPLLGKPAADGSDSGSDGFGPDATAADVAHHYSALISARHPALLDGVADADDSEDPVLPSAAYVEILLALQDAEFGHSRGTIHDLELAEPLRLPAEGAVEIRTLLHHPEPDGTRRVEVVSGSAEDPVQHAGARLRSAEDAAGADPRLLALAAAPGPVLGTIDAEDLATDLGSVGRRHGSNYRLLGPVNRHPDGVVTGDLTGREAAAWEQLPVELLECALHASAALDRPGPAARPIRFGAVRLFRKPRGAQLRVVAQVATLPDERASLDLLLFDGTGPVAEATGVLLAVPGPADERPRFLNRVAWLRHSAPAPRAQAERHVVVLGGDPERLLTVADTPGVRLRRLDGAEALAAALTDPSVTDVCWFWERAAGPLTAESLRACAEHNYTRLLAAVEVLARSTAGAPRLWLVTERGQWLPGDRPDTGEDLTAGTLWGFGHTLLNEYPRYLTTLIDLPAGGDLAVLAEEWLAQDPGDHQIAYRDGQRYVHRILAGTATPAWDGGFEFRAPESGELADLTPVPAGPAPEPGRGEVRVRIHVAAAGADDRADRVLGLGGAGVVEAAGAGVLLSVGDRVEVRSSGTLRDTVTVPAEVVAPIADAVPLAYAAARVGAELAGRETAESGAIPQSLVEYGIDEVDEAFVHLRRETAGIPVVRLCSDGAAGTAPVSADESTSASTPIRPDRAYLVTGGLGGLGLVTAEKLVELGARHLVLVSRSGRPADEARAVLDRLAEHCTLTVERADVGDPGDVAELFARLRGLPVPIGGIVHAAGTAGSALISTLTWPAIDAQLRAQAYGGWLLHEASLELPELELFAVHSSIAAIIGGSTQAHYAASFAFLDGLTAWRAASGRPALAVNWGMWSRVGVSARLDERLAREIERGGLRFFSPDRALRTLAELLPGPVPQYVAGEWDFPGYAAASPLRNALYRRVAGTGRPVKTGSAAAAPGLDLAELAARPRPQRLAAVSAAVLTGVGAALRAEQGEEVDPDCEFVSLGLDSLMAMDLKTGLERIFKVALPASLTFDHPSPRHLIEFLDAQIAPQDS